MMAVHIITSPELLKPDVFICDLTEQKQFYVNTDGTSWGNGCIGDTEPLPDGRRMTRQSYWLNNSFVREIVRDLITVE